MLIFKLLLKIFHILSLLKKHIKIIWTLDKYRCYNDRKINRVSRGLFIALILLLLGV